MDNSGRPVISIHRAPARKVTSLPFALWRRDIWLHSVIGLFVLAYCVSTIAVSRPSGFNTFWDGGVYTVAETIPVIAMILCAWRWPACIATTRATRKPVPSGIRCRKRRPLRR